MRAAKLAHKTIKFTRANAKQIQYYTIYKPCTMPNYQSTTGLIELEEMEFYAYHGCFEEEQRVGNRFMVHIAIHTNCMVPATTDCIVDALNYVSVYEITRAQMAIKSHLLEHVTRRIADALMQQFGQIEQLSVKVSKMTPPMGGQMKSVSTTLYATRSN